MYPKASKQKIRHRFDHIDMTAKPLSLSLGADRQSLAQAEIGTVYSQLLAKKSMNNPFLWYYCYVILLCFQR